MNHGNFVSAKQGSTYLAFGNQPIIPATSVVTSAWSVAVKSEGNPITQSSTSVSNSYPHVYSGRQFPFLQVPESPLSGVSSAAQALHHHDPENCGDSNNSGNDIQKSIFCNGLNQVLNSDSALSLLSSSTSETPEMGLGRIIHHPSPTNPTRPMISSLHYNSHTSQYPGTSQGHGLDRHPEGSGIFSNIRSNDNICHDVFQNETDASSASVCRQSLSSWE